MGKSATFTRTWIGLGLAAGLFLGCQQFLGQEDKSSAPSGGDLTDSQADMALKLTMKETAECRDLRDQVLAADSAGAATVTLQTDFIRKCIEEVRSADSAGKVLRPADLLPHDGASCRWLVSGIVGGHEELVVTFRHYCPDECDTLKTDTAHHADICRDPVTGCADIKARMAYLDPNSEEFARLRLAFAEHCLPRDTLPPKDPPPTLCESLKARLATLVPGTPDYTYILERLRKECHADTGTPVPHEPTLCESLKARLATLVPGTPDHDHILEVMRKECHADTGTPVPPESPTAALLLCDSLRSHLAGLEPSSEAYALAKHRWSQACVEPRPLDPAYVAAYCGQLTRTLLATDSDSPVYVFLHHEVALRCTEAPPVTPADPPAPIALCDSLRLLMSTLDPSSLEYARTKDQWYQLCVETKPIDDAVICGHLVSRYKATDPASPEYSFLKHEAVHRCPSWLPAEPVTPLDPVKPTPDSPECVDIRKRMSQPGLSSHDYDFLKRLFTEKCMH